MKFLVCLAIIGSICLAVYGVKRKDKLKALALSLVTAFILLSFLGMAMYRDATAPDKQCTSVHSTSSFPPATLTSAMDYFLQGNYDYDRGDCAQAVIDYTKSIKLNPKYPQAYNNRAYTNMRMQNYQDALPDLDKAISLKPDYIQALMNRGDIHNYYYAIDRASAILDYEKIIALGGEKGTSVCGHLFLARHNGWTLQTLFDLPFRYSCEIAK